MSNTPMPALLEVTGLAKSFAGHYAVEDVGLKVAKGEVRGIIGPNGAGKTTLFHLLSGYLRPTRGQIFLSGVDITGRRPHQIARHGVTRAFQTTNIFPTFTVFDNVLLSVIARYRLSFRLWGKYNDELVERVNEILEWVHLGHVSGKVAGTLAHGEQRALEIAIALGGDPDLLLLDEPTAGMSPFETQEMIRLLRDIANKQELTIILSEHDMDVVFGLANRVTVMEAGRVLAEGGADEIRSNPEVRRAYLGDLE